jgi:hypothetical protein
MWKQNYTNILHFSFTYTEVLLKAPQSYDKHNMRMIIGKTGTSLLGQDHCTPDARHGESMVL